MLMHDQLEDLIRAMQIYVRCRVDRGRGGPERKMGSDMLRVIFGLDMQ